jgi:hypothetical protein
VQPGKSHILQPLGKWRLHLTAQGCMPTVLCCTIVCELVASAAYCRSGYASHSRRLLLLLLLLQVIIGVPGEFTTMAGRRIRAAVANTIGSAWGTDLKVNLHARLLTNSCAAGLFAAMLHAAAGAGLLHYVAHCSGTGARLLYSTCAHAHAGVPFHQWRMLCLIR